VYDVFTIQQQVVNVLCVMFLSSFSPPVSPNHQHQNQHQGLSLDYIRPHCEGRMGTTAGAGSKAMIVARDSAADGASSTAAQINSDSIKLDIVARFNAAHSKNQNGLKG
jgi:hypothetical protein